MKFFAMKSNNIEASGPGSLTWDPAKVADSLKHVLTYVEQEAQKSLSWYFRNKRGKSFLSQWIRFLAVVLTSAAAIVPLLGPLLHFPALNNPLWASVLVGLAAALLALDRAFGFSSGWARYVMAATNIRKSLEEFKMDWEMLAAQAGPNPSPVQVQALLQRARDFRIAVEGLVLQETKDWVSEFQNNMAQLEKDVAAQLAELKAQTEKAGQARELANQPGAIQLTVPNADKSDTAAIQIHLQGATGVVADEPLAGSKTWVRLNLTPGHYELTVSATVGGKPVSDKTAVTVSPSVITQAQVALPA
jgi:hypothetical protein